MVPDVLVIGAGHFGSAAALHLARSGLSVVVVDARLSAAGDSASGLGAITLQSRGYDPSLPLALTAVAYYAEFLSELDFDVEYRECGGLALIDSEADLEPRLAAVNLQRERYGIRLEFLDAAATREAEPSIGPEVFGSTFCAQEAHLNPLLLQRGLERACARAGVTTLAGERVVSITRTPAPLPDSAGASPETITFEITTHSGTRISTPVIVNCAGPGLAEVARLAGIDLDIRQGHTHMLATNAAPPTIRHLLSGCLQTVSGNILINSRLLFDPRDAEPGWRSIRSMLRKTLHRMPGLAGLELIRAWSGRRPYPADGQPVIGEVPGVRGFYIATAHAGTTLSPLSGKILAELITSGNTPVSIAPFSPQRLMATPKETAM